MDLDVAALIAFAKCRLPDLLTDERLIAYARDVMGKTVWSATRIQKTLEVMEERGHPLLTKWEVSYSYQVAMVAKIIKQIYNDLCTAMAKSVFIEPDGQTVVSWILMYYQLGKRTELSAFISRYTEGRVDLPNDLLVAFAQLHEDFPSTYWAAAKAEATRNPEWLVGAEEQEEQLSEVSPNIRH